MKKTLLIVLLFFCVACKEDADVILSQAKDKITKQDFQEAIVLLDKLLADEPSADGFNVRGIAYFEMKKYEDAIKNFNEAIKMDNAKYKYFYNRANAYQALQNMENAIQDYEKALTLKDDVYQIYFNKANALASLNRQQEAIEDYGKALLLDDQDKNIYCNRAISLISLSNFGKAQTDLLKCLEIDEDFAKAHYLFAKTEIDSLKQTTSEGCEHLEKALELGYTEADSLYQKYCKGQKKETTKSFN
ncbi:MAG: tetratricopeptide repeat protein [Bacteroidetes bacterium]|nr:MAG: tetratricopeptide repeat protein [Bacteroidota bacterium]